MAESTHFIIPPFLVQILIPDIDLFQIRKILQKNAKRGKATPVVFEEIKNSSNPLGQINLNSLLNATQNRKMYSEEEVLSLVRHLVKEFGNIMNKYYCPQIPSLNNGGATNLNSILLLSLLLNNQNMKNTSQENPLLNQNPIFSNLNSNLRSSQPPFSSLNQLSGLFDRNIPNPLLKPNDLSLLLNRESLEKGDQNVSSENLLHIPKLVSCTGMNNLNLDMKLDAGCNVQSDNSYNFASQLLGGEALKIPSNINCLKKYDSCQAETKEESFSSPTL